MDCGFAGEFSMGVVGGEDIASSGIRKNSQEADLRKLLSDGVGTADRQNGAGPCGGESLGRSDGSANA